MLNQYFKKNPLFGIFHSTLVGIPAPSSLSLIWNFGSLLSLCLIVQLVSGIILATSYLPYIDIRFSRIALAMESRDSLWLFRYIHANGASLFFVCLYIHVARGIFCGSYLFTHTWNIGVTILLITMAAAFLGYVLPSNQISFWGASVITNLFSEVPYIGPDLIQFIWGGPRVSSPTILRFFTFHFIIPFVILALTVIHITFLHQTGSGNPLGISSNLDKIPFHIYFSRKDLMGVVFVFFLYIIVCLYSPLALGDDENFAKANPSVTPHHIQPEWYFLFAYAILRSIPNKLGGVIALALSIIVLYVIPYIGLSKIKSVTFYPLRKFLFWFFLMVVVLLTWIGICSVEEPYVFTGQVLTVMYFFFYIVNSSVFRLWDSYM